jgi:hypothetical protein
MKKIFLIVFAAIVAATTLHTNAQFYDTNGVVVQTFAGSGFYGYLDGVGQLTMFDHPHRVTADSSGNLFVFDGGNYRIRKITPDGNVSTFAGGGFESLPGYGTNVMLFGYVALGSGGAMTTDRSNSIVFVSNYNAPKLVKIRADGYATTTNLPGLANTSGLCFDSANNLYYSTPGLNKIYRWQTNGVLETFVGSGNQGSVDGNGVFTSFWNPTALTCDAADNIYVWDSGNHLIRRINPNRDVETISGREATDEDGLGRDADFNSITAICSDNAGNIYLACATSIRKMTAATNVTTLAGNFIDSGYVNGSGNLARFSDARGICAVGGTIYIADANNHRIRSITNNPTAQPVLPANLQLRTYPGLSIVGTVGRTYKIQSSPNTVNWTNHATLLLTASPYLWFDQNPVSGSKYYRALLLP